LKLPISTSRQVQGDMIEVYTFITGDCSVQLQLHSCTVSTVETRGDI